jgi:transglutaminase-like putative cysteine protease
VTRTSSGSGSSIKGHGLERDPAEHDGQQRFRYEYAAPISELRQRLVVVPRPVHGNQRRLSHRLEVSEARFRRRMRADRFGNVVLQISIPKVGEAVEFDVSINVERSTG